MALYFQPPIASVDWASFEPRYRSAVRSTGVNFLEERSCGSDVEIPIDIRLRLPSQPEPRIHLEIGFPDGGVRYVVTRDGISRIDCSARYQGGRAVYIEIRFPRQQSAVADALRDALAKEFPGLPIRLRSK
jgi:hypothetical protein